MPNLVTTVIQRIETRRLETATPCKSYSTEEKAEAVAQEKAAVYANYFAKQEKQFPCRYIVAYNAAWGRWIVAFDFTELLNRSTSTGGYVGIAAQDGFYTF